MSQENEQLQSRQDASLEKLRILYEALERGKTISILIEESPGQFPSVLLLSSRNCKPQELARIVFTQESPAASPPQIAQMGTTPREWLLVYEPQEKEQLNRFAQVGKYLPAFLNEIIEGAGRRPIWIFRSIEEYRLQLPFVRIRYFGNLITANIASTAQPTLS